MEGREKIEIHTANLRNLINDIDITRDVVAKYANNVNSSIHAMERTIDAREAVRRIDFARELLILAASTLEQAVNGWEHEIPLLRHTKGKCED